MLLNTPIQHNFALYSLNGNIWRFLQLEGGESSL